MKKLSIFLHKLSNPILTSVFKSIKIHEFVYFNEMPDLKENAVFAANHSNAFDVPYTRLSVKRHFYILAGKQPLTFVERAAFNINGTVWFDRKDKNEKKVGANKMIDLLKSGASFMMCPEGTWNLTPSKPMLPLYWGVIDIARNSGKPILPIVLEYTEKKCYIAFGSPMYVSQNDDKKAKINELTDQYATLKWQIWEKYPDTGYNSLEEWENEVKKRVGKTPQSQLDYERSVVRKEFQPFEKLIDINKITPTRANAFLFSKRNHN